MSSSPDRNIWIPSRVPQTLRCSQCGRTSHFNDLRQPDHYEYTCNACHGTKLFTLSEINALEAVRFHKVPSGVSNIISINAHAGKR
jgi:hypothetical protein